MNNGQEDYPDRTGCFAVLFGAMAVGFLFSLILNIILIISISHG